ncbi:exported hypothetical protein [Candidatus Desulfarcum epimagneticum]|uniref:Lipoprotein n=1 Tax=uncultured Desulfobacteraceae bacterium TaxID=218296 RepID=A0A484HJ22_9BACT|nr:exported hypothetical protein [uncultured Desulfobacteraceae bacterium]
MKKFFFGILALIVSGCAMGPKLQPLPVFNIEKNSRIGIINFIPPNPKHIHIGTTVFNNFKKEYQVDWNIPGFINGETRRQAARLGYKTVIIKPDETLKAQLTDRTLVKENRTVLNPSVSPLLSQLTEQYGINLLFIFEPAEGGVVLHNVVRVEGHGLGTRSVLGMGYGKAFAMFDADAVCLKPLSPTRGALCLKDSPIPGFKVFGNMGKISKEDKDKAGAVIKNFIMEWISDLMKQSNLDARSKR